MEKFLDLRGRTVNKFSALLCFSQLEKQRAAEAKAAGMVPEAGEVDLLAFDDADLALATFDSLIDEVCGLCLRFGGSEISCDDDSGEPCC